MMNLKDVYLAGNFVSSKKGNIIFIANNGLGWV